MNKTTLALDTTFRVGAVDPRVFGGFLEHIGRAVYEGVFDPQSVHADEDGFRKDVMAALRRQRYTAMRYPGGNFASGYHWMDGVGPRNQRPVMRELAWQSLESNQFGTDEFIKLSRKMGWTPMLTVNLGTGTPEEARNWVEYCNCPPPSKYAAMRAANGYTAPHAVKLWCLGNEMDGPWQLGHVPAAEYAVRAQQAAKMMKDVDKSIEVVACGSCSITLPTYLEWDRTALEYLGDMNDYISLHRYVGNRENDTADYLAVTNSIDQQIEELDATCRYVQGRLRSKKRSYLCFDEWNVWYKNRDMDGEGKFAPHLVEEVYNLEDALVTAGFLNSFIRHADAVKIANIAQIVNVIAPLQTRGDELLIQASFYPIEMIASRGRGDALRAAVQGPRYASKSYGEATVVDASAILDGDTLQVFVSNRSLTETTTVDVQVADRPVTAFLSGELLAGPGAKAANTWENQAIVAPKALQGVAVQEGAASLTLPPLSFAALSLRLG